MDAGPEPKLAFSAMRHPHVNQGRQTRCPIHQLHCDDLKLGLHLESIVSINAGFFFKGRFNSERNIISQEIRT